MKYDAIVIGSGPNGLSAAIELARNGLSVGVLEAAETIGGGVRSAELTSPGFIHDICSAIHPMAVISPYFRKLNLAVEWIFPPAAAAHPLENGSAILYQDLSQTSERLGKDGPAWTNLFEPFVKHSEQLFAEILKPIRFPANPFLMARFGVSGIRSALSVAQNHFQEERAQALFSGCAAHSIISLKSSGSASFGIVIALGAHVVGWPLVKGGSQNLANALAAKLEEFHGEIQTDHPVRNLQDLPEAKAYLFDVTPRQLAKIAGDVLSHSYKKNLSSYRYGPGVFKMDFALDGPIPWKSAECAEAATVHVGGTMQEIVQAEEDTANGKHPEKPFLILAQQSLFDPTRAPSGKHTAWAYCHVPNGSTVDMSSRIENQIERFAPGFKDRILVRHSLDSKALELHNSNLVGGDIGGGSNELMQVIARPFPRWDPYSTSNPRMFLCSSSTPPGGGVHGMCGYNAARSVLKKVFGK